MKGTGQKPESPRPGFPATAVAKRDAPVPANVVPDLEDVMKAKMTQVSRKDFYKVGWSKEEGDVMAPSARVLQKWANDNDGRPICTKIVEAVTTQEGCHAKVRGWIGDENKPLVVHEEVVGMTWLHELEFLLTEAVAKGINLPKKDGSWGTENVKPPFNVEYDETTGVSRIVLTQPEHQLHVLAQWVRQKRFGLRACITKAESRIFRKLLGGEWRDEEEIQIEKDEVQDVAASKGIAPEPPIPPTTPPPVNTERLIPEGKKQDKTNGTVSTMAVKSLLTRFKDLGERFPGAGDQFDYESYLTVCAMGAMFERGASITEPKLEAMTPADSGKLWELIDKVAHGDEQALATLDALHTAGSKVVETLKKRGK
jgi:hypothetical protein